MVKITEENFYLNHTIIIFACYGFFSIVKDVIKKYNKDKVEIKFKVIEIDSDSDSSIVILNESDSENENENEKINDKIKKRRRI